MFTKKSYRSFDALPFDLTPMIDCVFLLIIFFMLVSEIRKTEYENLTLPIAHSAVDVDSGSNITMIVNVKNEGEGGQIYISGAKIDTYRRLKDCLRGKTREMLGNGGKLSNFYVIVRADHRVSYSKVREILTVASELGLGNIKFYTAEPLNRNTWEKGED